MNDIDLDFKMDDIKISENKKLSKEKIKENRDGREVKRLEDIFKRPERRR